MKNILRYLLLALVVIGFTVPVFGKAEAAKIAILPLANNVADNELSSLVNQDIPCKLCGLNALNFQSKLVGI